MKKKIVWLVVSCLMVLALLATSCAKAEEKAPAAKEAAPAAKEAAPAAKEAAPAVKEAAPAAVAEMVKVSLTKADGTKIEKLVEKPRYGGELVYATGGPILAWDEAYQAPWTLSSSLSATNEDLVRGNWARGPAGTGEFSHYYGDFYGMGSVSGGLAESWEFPDATTIIFHIRQGVKWQNKPPVNGREFTADDAVFNIKRIYLDIKTSTMYGMLGVNRPTEVYATDKYTVVMKVPKGGLGDAFTNLAVLTKMVPPEVVKKYGDMNNWETVTGTGAFMLTDYVPMSSAAWVRNPNYWGYDPVLGKDYPLPYLDTLKLLIIPDVSTLLSAFRTGKVDWEPGVGWSREDALPLIKSNPNLKWVKMEPSGCSPWGFRVDKPELPFKDIRVRRALLMGINFQEIRDTILAGEAEIINYKIAPLPEYKALGWWTSYEELPPSTKELYTYNPEKAKQLLAEAGYPNGFKTEVLVNPARGRIDYVDQASIVKAYWAKIGIDLTIDVKEFGTFMSMYQRKAHNEMLFCGRGGMPASMYLCRKGNMYNWSMIDDPKIDDYYYPKVSAAFFDEPLKNKLMKEMNLYVLSQAWYYAPPSPYPYRIWQPWMKNYNGEAGPGAYSSTEHLKYQWIDRELKKALGY